jgi:hypothetical protein
MRYITTVKQALFSDTLKEMAHKQSKTPVHCNNAIAISITNNAIKRQCLRLMEMQFVWIGDKIAQDK